MPILSWKDEYSVKVEELDNHHKALFRILNDLYDDCLVPDLKSCVASKIAELISYSDYHFPTEEQYMKQIGFTKIDNHIEEHMKFRNKISELRQVKYDEDLELTRELIVFLGNWLINHVLVEDKAYSS